MVGGLFSPGVIRVSSVEERKRINLYFTKDFVFFFNFGFEEKSWPLTFFCFAVQFVCSKQTIKQFQRNEFKILYMRVFLKQMQTTDFAALIFKFVMWLLLVSRSWVVPRVGTKFSVPWRLEKATPKVMENQQRGACSSTYRCLR